MKCWVLVPFLLVFGSCNWSKKEDKIDPGTPVKVQIPVFVDGDYQLKIVELTTLSSLTDFSGTSAKFLFDAGKNQIGKLSGKTPNIRYIRDEDDVIIALDDQSLQVLTVYAHFEKLRELDSEVGATGVLSYPRTVAIDSKFKTSDGILENNAVYSGKYDALLVTPFTESTLPLMANAGVIGHEHFHALFFKLVIEPLGAKFPQASEATMHEADVGDELSSGRTKRAPTTPRDRYHTALMRGINEGFADLWGWIYSGDNSFVGRSLPQQKLIRDLEVIPTSIYGRDELLGAVLSGESDDSLLQRSYDHGVQLARTLRNFAILAEKSRGLSDAQARSEMGVLVKKSLPDIAKQFAALKPDEYYSLATAIAAVVNNQSKMSSMECNFVAKLLPAEEIVMQDLRSKCKDIEANENNRLDKLTAKKVD